VGGGRSSKPPKRGRSRRRSKGAREIGETVEYEKPLFGFEDWRTAIVSGWICFRFSLIQSHLPRHHSRGNIFVSQGSVNSAAFKEILISCIGDSRQANEHLGHGISSEIGHKGGVDWVHPAPNRRTSTAAAGCFSHPYDCSRIHRLPTR
jgi:hypothetical protein